MMNEFNEQLFQRKVDSSLKAVERILALHRDPRLAQDVDHDYVDKYSLVDQMTNTALIGQFNVLSYFGLTSDILKSIDKSKPATLRFQASDTCKFLKEQTVEVPMDRTEEEDELTQTTGSSFFGNTSKSTIKQIIKHVQEFHWKVDVTWEISLYSGTDIDGKKILKSRSSSMVLIIQSNKRAPLPEHRECKPLNLSLSWLMGHIDTETMTSCFSIDRHAPTTKTPRRNYQVETAIKMISELVEWTSGVRAYFTRCVQQDIIDKHNPAGPTPTLNPHDRLTSLSCDDIFIPVQPLLETSKGEGGDDETRSKSILSIMNDNESTSPADSPLLSRNDIHTFLDEQIRSIDERVQVLMKIFPSEDSSKLLSIEEALITVLSLHSGQLGESFTSSVNYVEAMLANQLVAAIGKSINSSDIDQFLQYHNARFLNPAPQAFCHAIRQAGHDPCGLLSIEGIDSEGKKEPIHTLSRDIESSNPIKLPLNSATTVELTGQKYLHGWIQHRFGSNNRSHELTARARQFSAFLLVIGTMAGPDKLNPTDAIIVQNKDDLQIPLFLDEIPTSTEFKHAIHSLSPDQQRFAEAFRSMQLGSSVMGICVIQIKPQLEALLGLPRDSLLKEMKLTQDLMELFIEYQVPSDLLSYDGVENSASPKEMVDTVRGHAKAVFDVIGEAKQKQLEEQTMRADMAYEMAEQRCFAAFDGCNLMAMGASVSHVNPSSSAPTVVTAHQQKSIATAVTMEGKMDVTQLPEILDSAIEEFSCGASLRCTTVSLSNSWLRIRQENLLSKPKTEYLESDDSIKAERNKAFDLLDAISRSGSLSIACSELHVIVAVTHCFEKDVIETIVQDNINPIEKLEMSTLLLGSIIHGVPAFRLVREETDWRRLEVSYPALLSHNVDDE